MKQYSRTGQKKILPKSSSDNLEQSERHNCSGPVDGFNEAGIES